MCAENHKTARKPPPGCPDRIPRGLGLRLGPLERQFLGVAIYPNQFFKTYIISLINHAFSCRKPQNSPTSSNRMP